MDEWEGVFFASSTGANKTHEILIGREQDRKRLGRSETNWLQASSVRILYSNGQNPEICDSIFGRLQKNSIIIIIVDIISIIITCSTVQIIANHKLAKISWPWVFRSTSQSVHLFSLHVGKIFFEAILLRVAGSGGGSGGGYSGGPPTATGPTTLLGLLS